MLGIKDQGRCRGTAFGLVPSPGLLLTVTTAKLGKTEAEASPFTGTSLSKHTAASPYAGTSLHPATSPFARISPHPATSPYAGTSLHPAVSPFARISPHPQPLRTQGPLFTQQPLLLQGSPSQPHNWTPPQQRTPVLSPAAAPSPGEP